MEKDPTYEKFLSALKNIVKKDWYRKNEALAAEAKISKGYLSAVLRGNKKASFKIQTALIKAATDFSYEEFLELGRQIIEKEKSVRKPEPTETPKPTSEPERSPPELHTIAKDFPYEDIITLFHDPDNEKAMRLCLKLVELGKLAPDKLDYIEGLIDGMLELLRPKQSKKAVNEN